MREALVDLDAIQHNVRTITELIAPAKLMVVVKADAYGHGAIPVALAAEEAGAAAFAVVDLEEARLLRDGGVTTPILTWLYPSRTDFTWAIGAGIELGIGSLEQLEGAASAGRAVVHLKVDTGLGRGGVVGEDWRRLVERAAELEREGRLAIRGVWSHLARAGEEADEAQIDEFDRALAIAREAGLAPEWEHLAASASVFDRPRALRSLVRVGLSAYGLSPFPDRTPASLGLRPAMELAGEVIQVKRVPADWPVSYGHLYRTERETTLAIVPLGYADGLPRNASGSAPVAIRGKRYTVAGRIAMDQVVVDVGDDEVAVGDRAVFFGDGERGLPTAQEWADAASTIPYEIVSRIGPRVTRRYRR